MLSRWQIKNIWDIILFGMMKEKKNMVDRFVKIAPVEGNPYLAHSAEPPPPKNWRLQYIYIFFNLFVLKSASCAHFLICCFINPDSTTFTLKDSHILIGAERSKQPPRWRLNHCSSSLLWLFAAASPLCMVRDVCFISYN